MNLAYFCSAVCEQASTRIQPRAILATVLVRCRVASGIRRQTDADGSPLFAADPSRHALPSALKPRAIHSR
jgi:hypothetical protein